MIYREKEITVDDAIRIMKETRVKVASGTVKSYEMARDLLVKEAGYRTPKKPALHPLPHAGYLTGTCPACSSRVDEIEDTAFCHECGQKLTW